MNYIKLAIQIGKQETTCSLHLINDQLIDEIQRKFQPGYLFEQVSNLADRYGNIHF